MSMKMFNFFIISASFFDFKHFLSLFINDLQQYVM